MAEPATEREAAARGAAATGRLRAAELLRTGNTPSGLAGMRQVNLAGSPGPLMEVPPSYDGSHPLPLLVAFHGDEGDAAQSVALLGAAARDAGVLLLAMEAREKTWDLIAVRSLGVDFGDLDDAIERVVTSYPVDRGRIAFAGFSDGASYALSLGLANGDVVQTILAFSPGFAAPPREVGSPRVFISHGISDEVLPAETCGRQIAAVMRATGRETEYVEFDGAHVVPPEVAAAGVAWWLGLS